MRAGSEAPLQTPLDRMLWEALGGSYLVWGNCNWEQRKEGVTDRRGGQGTAAAEAKAPCTTGCGPGYGCWSWGGNPRAVGGSQEAEPRSMEEILATSPDERLKSSQSTASSTNSPSKLHFELEECLFVLLNLSLEYQVVGRWRQASPTVVQPQHSWSYVPRKKCPLMYPPQPPLPVLVRTYSSLRPVSMLM